MTQSPLSEPDDANAYGLRGKRVASKMLELRLKTGQSFAIGYHWLQAVSFTPHHRIEATFTTHAVVIEGRHLKDLYHGLLEHRIPFIQEGDLLYDSSPQSETFVALITVEPR